MFVAQWAVQILTQKVNWKNVQGQIDEKKLKNTFTVFIVIGNVEFGNQIHLRSGPIVHLFFSCVPEAVETQSPRHLHAQMFPSLLFLGWWKWTDLPGHSYFSAALPFFVHSSRARTHHLRHSVVLLVHYSLSTVVGDGFIMYLHNISTLFWYQTKKVPTRLKIHCLFSVSLSALSRSEKVEQFPRSPWRYIIFFRTRQCRSNY